MQYVILFGGGDAGGLIIGPNGIKPIPPFDPAIVASIKFVTAVQRLQSAGSPIAGELAKPSTRLAGEVLEHVGQQIGGLQKGTELVVFDDGDGWYCGTPPHPRPLPHGAWSESLARSV